MQRCNDYMFSVIDYSTPLLLVLTVIITIIITIETVIIVTLSSS